ncbi:MAG: cytokinin dehydrogenase [Actinomycetota bacterium]|nr:cytokinin dehydrogenase [Actinomycetota bacterium]
MDTATRAGSWSPALLDELARVTRLRVDRGVRARHVAASDWGGIVVGAPAAVIRPRRVEEVAQTVLLAAEHSVKLTLRGTGASSGGQSVAGGWVTLDMTGLDDVSVDPDSRTVSCGPGATWRSVLARTLPHGLQPVVMPLHLDLTLGGSLATGCFGAVGHRFGVAAGHVAELEVVTGAGAVLRCSRDLHARLFDGVRGGLGHCGAITRAVLNLRPAPPFVEVSRLRAGDGASWVATIDDLGTALGADETVHVSHIEGLCRAEDGRVVYDVHVGREHGDEPAALPDAYRGTARLIDRQDQGFAQHANRFDARFDDMVSSGHTAEGHPWLECLLSPDALSAVLADVLAGIAGDEADVVKVFPVRREGLPPLVVSPPAEMLMCLVVAPRGIPAAELPRALEAMARVDRLLADAGGKRYLAGWLPAADEQAWERHFGPAYAGWLAARREYDPSGTFTSALFAGARGVAPPGDSEGAVC